MNFKSEKGCEYSENKKNEEEYQYAYHQSSGIKNKLVLLLKQKFDNRITISLRLRFGNFDFWLPILFFVQLIKKTDIHDYVIIIAFLDLIVTMD